MGSAQIQNYDYGGGITYKPLENMTDQEFDNYLSQKNRKEGRLSKLGLGNQSNSSQSSNAFGSGSNTGSNNNSSSQFDFKTGALGSLTDQAKDLAQFNLGLNKDQSQFDFGLRNQEFDANTGRQMKINDQQNTWQSQLNRDTQDAQTNRLNLQIAGQDRQQQAGFGQQNFMTANAVRLASRRLGQ